MMDECVNQTFFLHKKNYCYVIVLLLTFDSSICTSNIKNIYISIYKEISILPMFPIRTNACSIISV